MALNPKLNVYVVTLNPKDKDSHPTFRDFFREKFNMNAIANSSTPEII